MDLSQECLWLRDIVSKQLRVLENLLAHVPEETYVHDVLEDVIETLDYGLNEHDLELSSSDHLFMQYLAWAEEMGE